MHDTLERDPRARAVMATLFITAVMSNDLQEVRQLLKQGADIEAADHRGFPPLHVAVGAGTYEIAELLLAHGANPNSRNVQGGTALHFAANGFPRIVALLLGKGAHASTSGPANVTPLHVAVQYKQTEIVKLLVDSGADLNARIAAGHTALQIAQEDGQEDIVRILRAAGADASYPSSASGPNPRELELFRSASPEVQATAIVQAAMDNNVPRATSLIDDFSCDVNGVTDTGFTALHAAVVRGHEPMVELLLSRGADPNVRERDESPVLFRAVGVGHAWAVRRLLEKGADPNATGANKGTALHVAAAMGKEDIVKLLLESGAKSTTDTSGNTPGMVAFSRGHRQVAALLGVTPFIPRT